jgi:hypothetical protein
VCLTPGACFRAPAALGWLTIGKDGGIDAIIQASYQRLHLVFIDSITIRGQVNAVCLKVLAQSYL